MNLVTVKINEKECIGIAEDNYVLHLKAAEVSLFGDSIVPDSMLEAIDLGEVFINRVKEILENLPLNDRQHYYPITELKLLAPIPIPRKNVFCVGKNYADHAIEMGSIEDIPQDIIIFTKAPTTVIGHEEVVSNHKELTSQLDYEGELAVVIGKAGKGILKEHASDYIFGYTILNDITARDLQTKHKQFFLGKSLDTTCPLGPWIVHKSQLLNPNDLKISTSVNGELRQNSNTRKCIFSIEEIISILSRGMTLQPGDIIATGTPAGVGKGLHPPKFLNPGDEIEITIEGIGTLRNVIEK
jgi:2-keto-4-pentenoate hydratase/2-oxohepta-3-ene-1,7-dioic acid hydratase in catechol pathway